MVDFTRRLHSLTQGPVHREGRQKRNTAATVIALSRKAPAQLPLPCA